MLVQDGLEVIALDLLGIAAQAARLATALRKLNWDGSAIVGHDLGGGVAQLICADDPEASFFIGSVAYESFPEPGIAWLKDPA